MQKLPPGFGIVLGSEHIVTQTKTITDIVYQ